MSDKNEIALWAKLVIARDCFTQSQSVPIAERRALNFHMLSAMRDWARAHGAAWFDID